MCVEGLHRPTCLPILTHSTQQLAEPPCTTIFLLIHMEKGLAAS